MPARPIAVLVCHGVGQQVPFETVDLVARAVREGQRLLGKTTPDEPRAEIVQAPAALGGRMLPRVRVSLRTADGHAPEREVHLYEAYWAPLTEGKVSIRDVFWFLLGGGLRGLQHSEANQWERRLFGKVYHFPRPRLVAAQFSAAFLVFLPLVFINFVIVTVGGSRLTLGAAAATPWPSDPAMASMTLGLLILLAGFALSGGVTFGFSAVRNARTTFAHPYRLPTLLQQIGWRIIWLSLALPLVVSVIFGASLLGVRYLATELDPLWPVVWLLALAASAALRQLLVEYLGDVAAYVSAYRLSTLWEVREAIKKACIDVGRVVYGWREPDGSLLYESVIVIGHSLGSVIAYDMYNALINEDLAADELASIRLPQRTPLFLTMSSPLDKTAFIFTTRLPARADVRELLAAAKQPLILDWSFRPARWINIWSPDDWINGSLEYYDPRCTPESVVHRRGECRPDAPCKEGGAKRVQNVKDEDARTPLVAHNEPWTNPTFMRVLYTALTSTGQREPVSAAPDAE